MRKTIIIIAGILLLAATVFLGYFFRNAGKQQQLRSGEVSAPQITRLSPAKEFEKIPADFLRQKYAPEELGTVSSEFGFALKYPQKIVQASFGDDERFQAIFAFFPMAMQISEDDLEKINSDINNVNLYAGLNVRVYDYDGAAELSQWASDLVRNERDAGRRGKIVSQEDEEVLFSETKGRIITAKINGSDSGSRLSYAIRNIFIIKGSYIYRFSYLVPTEDAYLLKSGETGKKYLQQVGDISAGILKSLVFDGSKQSKIVVAKTKRTPKMSDDSRSRLEELLTVLRQEPFFGNKEKYPVISNKEACKKGTSLINDPGAYSNEKEMQPASAAYFGVDKKYAKLHAYDVNGNHTGMIPNIFGLGADEMMEEQAEGFQSILISSDMEGISMHDNVDGKIEVVGKDFSFVDFRITGDGNECVIAEMFLPATPFSVCTLKMNVNGNIGPFSCDIDGDEQEDLKISLVHPLTPEKQNELVEAMSYLKNNIEN